MRDLIIGAGKLVGHLAFIICAGIFVILVFHGFHVIFPHELPTKADVPLQQTINTSLTLSVPVPTTSADTYSVGDSQSNFVASDLKQESSGSDRLLKHGIIIIGNGSCNGSIICGGNVFIGEGTVIGNGNIISAGDVVVTYK